MGLTNLTVEDILVIVGFFLIFYSILNIEITIADVTLPKLDHTRRIITCIFAVVMIIAAALSANDIRSTKDLVDFFNGVEKETVHKLTEESYFQQRFDSPMFRKKHLDFCIGADGRGCGWGAASVWCQRIKGFKTAIDFEEDSDTLIETITKRIGDEYVCKDKEQCSTFKYIICIK